MNTLNDSIKSNLVFENYTVDYINFRTNPGFEAESVAVNFKLDSKLNTIASEAHVTLLLELFPNAEQNNYPFEMELSITGHFRTVEDAGDLFRINAISILFPYLRALVTTFTSNCNVSPLILPPINVHNLITRSD